jgi:hypothetical protein
LGDVLLYVKKNIIEMVVGVERELDMRFVEVFN